MHESHMNPARKQPVGISQKFCHDVRHFQ